MEVRVAAPRVGVEAEEVGLGVGRVFQIALEVVHRVFQDLSHICGRVTNGDLTFGVFGDVVFHVTLERLQQLILEFWQSKEVETYPKVSRNLLRALLVDHLIPGKERKGVRIVLEGLDDTKDLLEVSRIVAALWVSPVQVISLQGRVDV